MVRCISWWNSFPKDEVEVVLSGTFKNRLCKNISKPAIGNNLAVTRGTIQLSPPLDICSYLQSSSPCWGHVLSVRTQAAANLRTVALGFTTRLGTSSVKSTTSNSLSGKILHLELKPWCPLHLSKDKCLEYSLVISLNSHGKNTRAL